jgi:hypothetical protein
MGYWILDTAQATDLIAAIVLLGVLTSLEILLKVSELCVYKYIEP